MIPIIDGIAGSTSTRSIGLDTLDLADLGAKMNMRRRFAMIVRFIFDDAEIVEIQRILCPLPAAEPTVTTHIAGLLLPLTFGPGALFFTLGFRLITLRFAQAGRMLAGCEGYCERWADRVDKVGIAIDIL